MAYCGYRLLYMGIIWRWVCCVLAGAPPPCGCGWWCVVSVLSGCCHLPLLVGIVRAPPLWVLVVGVVGERKRNRAKRKS